MKPFSHMAFTQDYMGCIVGPGLQRFYWDEPITVSDVIDWMNEAFEMGREHESAKFSDIIGIARRVLQTPGTDVAILLQEAIERYDNRE